MDESALAGFLASVLPAGRLEDVRPVSGGRSNLTYFLRWAGRDYVLRRPPASASGGNHDVGREWRILSALAATPVATPTPRAFCADPDVLGAPFYVMDRVDGRVLTTAAGAPDLAVGDRAAALGAALVDALVSIHAVDYAAVGLASLGRPQGYVYRQASRWHRQWTERQQRSIPEFDEIGRRLVATLDRGHVDPDADAATLVHGDFNLGNVLVSDDVDGPPTVRAVLDWEFGTLGHPLMDLGLLMSYNGPYGHLLLECDPLVSDLPGFPAPDALADLYAARSGRDTAAMDFYYVLAFYRTLIINEDVRRRYLAGEATGDAFKDMGRTAPVIAAHLLDVADRSPIPGLNGRPS